MCAGSNGYDPGNPFATNNSGGGMGLRTSMPQVGPSGYTQGQGPANSITAQPGQYTPYQTPDWINAGLYAANQPLTNYPVQNFGRWNWNGGATNGMGIGGGPPWPSPQSITSPWGGGQWQPGGWPSSSGGAPIPQQGGWMPGPNQSGGGMNTGGGVAYSGPINTPAGSFGGGGATQAAGARPWQSSGPGTSQTWNPGALQNWWGGATPGQRSAFVTSGYGGSGATGALGLSNQDINAYQQQAGLSNQPAPSQQDYSTTDQQIGGMFASPYIGGVAPPTNGNPKDVAAYQQWMQNRANAGKRTY